MTDANDPAERHAHRFHADRAEKPNQPDSSGDSASGAATSALSPPPATGSSPVDGATQFGWLHQELGRQLSAYRRRRKRDKRKAFALQMATVTLSATITVLLGLRTAGTTQQRLADVALILGALITVLAAAEAFFAHRGLWILRTQTVRRLETLARHLDYEQTRPGGRPLQPSVLDRYASELDDILTEDHTRWQHLRATAPESRNPPKTSNESSTAS